AHFLLRGEVGEGAADHAGADKGNLLASHGANSSFPECGIAAGIRTTLPIPQGAGIRLTVLP
ncbi:MAG TPA: hypothetical protein VFV30_05555, partial [Novosphingobium sp.]|nr:hypothetical protein [Novosphingobium sp.]